jgi:hypothetical protein
MAEYTENADQKPKSKTGARTVLAIFFALLIFGGPASFLMFMNMHTDSTDTTPSPVED